jgi:hypothetical protein
MCCRACTYSTGIVPKLTNYLYELIRAIHSCNSFVSADPQSKIEDRSSKVGLVGFA